MNINFPAILRKVYVKMEKSFKDICCEAFLDEVAPFWILAAIMGILIGYSIVG